MGGILGGGGGVEAPESKPVAPPPTEDTGAGEYEKKRLRKRKGRKSTFLTGDLVPTDTTEKKTFLG